MNMTPQVRRVLSGEFVQVNMTPQVRRVLSGEFVQVNRHLLRDLISEGLWNEDLKTKLIANNGSVQNIDEIPPKLKELYKTVWEIKQKRILELAADRGAFIDQSQSLNIHMINCRETSSGGIFESGPANAKLY